MKEQNQSGSMFLPKIIIQIIIIIMFNISLINNKVFSDGIELKTQNKQEIW